MTRTSRETLNPPTLTVVCGGLGGARLALAVQEAGLEAHSCFVTNVADDLVVDGLLVCPDTDSVLYAFAGVFDEERGWGIRGDNFPDAPRQGWFHIGEHDERHHLRRRGLLDRGLRLAEATTILADELGVTARVAPASDQPLRTTIRTHEGWLSFQEWLVKERAQPTPIDIRYSGAEAARPSGCALSAIRDADVVVLAPSSPVASIRPTMLLPGVAEALRDRSGPTIAVSPVARRRSPERPRDRGRSHARGALLRAIGIDHDPVAVAGLYGEVVDTFVVDAADRHDVSAIRRLGLHTLVAPTIGDTVERRHELMDALTGTSVPSPSSTSSTVTRSRS